MDNRGKGNTKGISSTFQSWNIFVVDVLDSCLVRILTLAASLWIERRALRTCIIPFMSDMQFKIYSIFHEHTSCTHGFCKPLLCGCTYCYFVYWNKEKSIYKIIKWSSPSSVHRSCMFFSFSVNCTFNDFNKCVAHFTDFWQRQNYNLQD